MSPQLVLTTSLADDAIVARLSLWLADVALEATPAAIDAEDRSQPEHRRTTVRTTADPRGPTNSIAADLHQWPERALVNR